MNLHEDSAMDQGRALQEGQRLVAGRRLLARASLAGSHNIEPGRSPTSPGLSAAKSQTSNVAYHPERGGGSNLPREVRVLPAHRLGVMSYAQRYGPGWCRISERSQTPPGRSLTFPGWSVVKSQTSRSEEFSPLPNRSKPPDRSAELLLFALSPGRLGL